MIQENWDAGSTIYTGKSGEEDVKLILSRHFSVEFYLSSTFVHPFHIDVTDNDGYKWNKGKQDDFVYWPFLVDIWTQEDVTSSDYIPFTSGVLTLLWGQGLPAVAACDFEHELPWSGGIQSPVMPPEHF
ncbi:hypothetical protein IDM40_27160 [Nocardiopsis sp. HNM0947]|uniref:Uncharacterized protein n=1 Tax=Nocardiopsis coralli TaxID=2772213 RepID=A0ABR9PET5_9ACTN|nr:hypothetical protein [Nocardiopsis coralli]MBE3002349.1 hypothetical protein [Nocardiopsis coralli]